MKRFLLTCIPILAASVANADNLANSDRFLCSISKIQVCFEDGVCNETFPWEVNVPQFVVVDTKEMTLSTTKASEENRSTPIRTLEREDGKIFLQGIEAGRAFSWVIDEPMGLVTVAVSRDGMSVSVFGACTDADI
jgi:hypothetical protein